MATIKEIKTTIKLRYDSLNNWIFENPTPQAGEACVAIIPTSSANQPDYTVGQYPTESGLTPYAVGLKIGDGINDFIHLPWIQSVAGDIYAWAKQSAPPNAANLNAIYNGETTKIQTVLDTLVNTLSNLAGEDIAVEYNSEDTDVQTAITNIEESIGGIVAANISPEALSNALNQLQEQLDDQSGDIFIADQNGVTYKIDTLIKQGLNLTATSSPLVVSDISDLIFNKEYNKTSNKAATMGDLTDLRTDILNSIPSAMRFRGSSTTEITDGGIENPTINDIEITSITEGDVVLYNNKEFIWTGTAWELLGDESSYAIKGSITKADLAQGLKDELDSKVNSTSLHRIATTGDIDDLEQTSIVIFDCGNATDKLYPIN